MSDQLRRHRYRCQRRQNMQRRRERQAIAPKPFTHTNAKRRNLASVFQRLITASTHFRLVPGSPVQSLVAHFGAVRMARAPEWVELQLLTLPNGDSTWTHVVSADGVMPRGKSVLTTWPIDDAT
jgi:hypothetical protein